MAQRVISSLKMTIGAFFFALILMAIFTTHPVYADCNHDWQVIPAKEPTETEDGNYEYESCSICNICKWGGQECSGEALVIPALGREGKYSSDEIDSVTLEPVNGRAYEIMDEDWDCCFGFYRFNADDVLRVQLKNGNTVNYRFIHNWICGDYSYFQNIDDPDDKIAYGNGFEDLDEPFDIAAGDTQDITAKYHGNPFSITISITPNPIQSVSYKVNSGDGVIRINENDSNFGHFEEDYNGNQYFFYNPPHLDGDEMTVEYSDGRTVTYTYDSTTGEFTNGSDIIVEDEVDCSTGQGGEHWYAGGTYYCNFGYNRRFTDDIPIQIIPVYNTGEYRLFPLFITLGPSIGSSTKITPEIRTASVSSVDEYDIVDDSISYQWDGDTQLVSITEDAAGGKTKYLIKRVAEGSGELTLTARWGGDNTATQTYSLDEYYSGCNHDWQVTPAKEPTDTEDGNLEYRICSICDECECEGRENTSVESCIIPALKSEGKYSADEIDSITFETVSGGTYKIMDEGNEYGFAWYMFNEGDTLKLHLKNGNTASYRYIENWYCGDYAYFQNLDDPSDKIAYGNGFDGLYESYQIAVGDTQDITIKYHGHPFIVTLEITPNPVNSVSYRVNSNDGAISICENDPDIGQLEKDEYGNQFFFYQDIPHFDGDEMTVEYADGRTVTYTYDSTTGEFTNGSDIIAEDEVDCSTGQYYEHWYAGGTNYCSFGYSRRFTDDIPIKIIPEYKAGEYRLFPLSIPTELRVGETIEIEPEIRTAPTDSANEYDTVNDSIEYQWSGDTQLFTITEDTTGITPKYMIKRKAEDAGALTLTASWGNNNTVTQTYYVRESYGGTVVPVPATEGNNTITIEALISDDGNAFIPDISDTELSIIPAGEDLIIDLSNITAVSADVVSASLPTSALDYLASSSTGGVEIRLDTATVNIDKATLAALATHASDDYVNLTVVTGTAAASMANSAQMNTVNGMNSPLLLDVSFYSNGDRISDFQGGTVTVKVPYESSKTVRVYFVNENGEIEPVESACSGGTVRILLKHCSLYAIEEYSSKPQVAPAAPVAPAVTEIQDLPVVKISKPKAGKKKMTVKWKKVSKKNQKLISGIQIQVATDPGFTNIVANTTAGKKKASKAIKKLQPKTTYYVRIRAYAGGNHVSAWKSKSVKVK